MDPLAPKSSHYFHDAVLLDPLESALDTTTSSPGALTPDATKVLKKANFDTGRPPVRLGPPHVFRRTLTLSLLETFWIGPILMKPGRMVINF